MGKAAARDKMRVVALRQHNHHLALRNAELLKELGELREASQAAAGKEPMDPVKNTGAPSAPTKIELLQLPT